MTNNSILACIDGSKYSNIICSYASWANKILKTEKIKLLHVQAPHSQRSSKNDDYSGSIGLGVKNTLLEKLTKIDEEEGKLLQQKGRLILEHGKEILLKNVNFV